MTMPERPVMKQIALDIGLASSPSFANFFCGPNEAALKHLTLWTGNALRSPVPTYLWGESASGKTHLLKAVREALREQGAASGWMDASIMEPPDFDERWAAVVLDDCHLYTAVQQQAAFNWFVNALNAPDGRPRWVLAAGNAPPADLQLREDLRSRLGWGHVFALEALTELERRSVLRKEADARGVFLSDEAMDFILSRFSRDLGSLMQLLDQLDGYALQTKRAITIPLIKSMLESE
jgi:DnaA-homolog protein